MYQNKKVDHTLDKRYMTTPLKKAQKEEFKKLKEIILQLPDENIKILDIGVGDARIPILLRKTNLWNKIGLYVGFDNSKIEIERAKKIIKDRKIKLFYFEANNLNNKKSIITKNKYELIICTYFTPGNFKPDEIKLNVSADGTIVHYPINCLNPNKKFVKIFRSAYQLLRQGGKIILGSVYIDSDINMRKQEAFYKKCGMTVITTKKDSFTATEEGFWSQRFTKERIYQYFSWLDRKDIDFIPLDNYNFAWMVVISKR